MSAKKDKPYIICAKNGYCIFIIVIILFYTRGMDIHIIMCQNKDKRLKLVFSLKRRSSQVLTTFSSNQRLGVEAACIIVISKPEIQLQLRCVEDKRI